MTTTGAVTSDHRHAIEALLTEAARTAADDASWDVLRRRARTLTRSLADAGIVPLGSVTALDDPPVVVARGLLVAARYVGATHPALASAVPSGDGRRGTWESCGTVAS